MGKVHVADVTVTKVFRAGRRMEEGSETRGVDISDDVRNKMAAPRVSIAIHGERGMPSPAQAVLAGMRARVEREERINFCKGSSMHLGVKPRLIIEGIDPEVNGREKTVSELTNNREMIGNANSPDAEGNPGSLQPLALLQKGSQFDLSRVKGGPKGQGPRIGRCNPIERAGEIRLDDDFLNVRKVTQTRERPLVGRMNKRFTPRRKQDPNPDRGLGFDPTNKTVQPCKIILKLCGVVARFRKGTVMA